MSNRKNVSEILDLAKSRYGSSSTFNEEEIKNEYAHLEMNQSSVAIKILTVFGGLLASLALAGFLALVGLFDSEGGLVVFGLVAICGSVSINVISENLLVDTLSISIYIMGIVLLWLGDCPELHHVFCGCNYYKYQSGGICLVKQKLRFNSYLQFCFDGPDGVLFFV